MVHLCENQGCRVVSGCGRDAPPVDNRGRDGAWAPFAEGRHDIFQHEVLLALAAKYRKSAAQIILRWLTQLGVVAIPKDRKSVV